VDRSKQLKSLVKHGATIANDVYAAVITLNADATTKIADANVISPWPINAKGSAATKLDEQLKHDVYAIIGSTLNAVIASPNDELASRFY